tara:strand:- start:2524 stop:3474 length:951 start_codon:yes stop_codon:yes gene_type:complete
MKILITGCCGFIGFNLSYYLLKNGFKIVGIDNIDNYYDIKIKYDRLKILSKNKRFKFRKINISNNEKVKKIFDQNKFDFVINLAAQAGVRYSIKNPRKYMLNNSVGFFNILENSRLKLIKNVIFASSSSVYGDKKKFPVKENDELSPKNFYGLTKKHNEEMAEIYSQLYNMNICGLRFFTVYGEWGRPDMFMLKYINSFKKFSLFNKGEHFRDFTYIKDVNSIIHRLINKKLKGFNILNICSNNPIKITKVIKMINNLLDKKKIKIKKLGLQRADVIKTHGCNDRMKKITKFKTFTPVEKGVESLVNWYKKKIFNK